MSDGEKNEASEHARSLAQSPGDIGAFLDVAVALLEIDKDAGCSALRSLSASANTTGQVATAVLAAILLRQAGAEEDAMSVLCEIADAHCLGSKKIDPDAKPQPLAPPASGDTNDYDSGGDPVEYGLAAVEKAAAFFSSRAPETFAPTPLISEMEPEEFFDLAQVIRVKEFSIGADVVVEGDSAEKLFWVARGTVDISRGGTKVGTLRTGAFFGEIALVGGTVRTATVSAASPLWVLEVDRKSVEELAQQQQNVARTLVLYARSRLLSTIMGTSELFKRLTEKERRQVRRKFETRVFEADETIVKKGVETDCLYVLISGRCEVRDGASVIATLTIGDAIGEMSLLSQGPASADVVATESSVMLALPRTRFDEVVLEHPQLLAEVYKLLRDRSQANNEADVVYDASDLVIS